MPKIAGRFINQDDDFNFTGNVVIPVSSDVDSPARKGYVDSLIGSQGVQGFTGVQGLAGALGSNGLQGSNGSVGTQGFIGVQGGSGVQGSAGVQGGAGGVQGSVGFQGSSGSQGFSGPQGSSSADIQEFNTNGTYTWTKPAGSRTMVKAIIIGAGGGGGAGAQGIGITNTGCGGAGGGGGGVTVIELPISSLGSTAPVIVGRGGVGGTATTGTGNAGESVNNATGLSSFSGFQSGGGGGGGGGIAPSGLDAVAGTAGTGFTGNGIAGSPSHVGGAIAIGPQGKFPSTGRIGASGGGSGATAQTVVSGLQGFVGSLPVTTHSNLALWGGNGFNGGNATWNNGAGLIRSAIKGQGAGDIVPCYGCGGGGGGGTNSDVPAGAGGNGADGYVIVITY